MGGGPAGPKRGGQQNGFSDFFFTRADLLRLLCMDFDAIHALRRMSDGNGDQFPIFARYFSIFSRHDPVQRRPGLKLRGRERFHVSKQLQIVFIVVMISQIVPQFWIRYQ